MVGVLLEGRLHLFTDLSIVDGEGLFGLFLDGVNLRQIFIVFALELDHFYLVDFLGVLPVFILYVHRSGFGWQRDGILFQGLEDVWIGGNTDLCLDDLINFVVVGYLFGPITFGLEYMTLQRWMSS